MVVTEELKARVKAAIDAEIAQRDAYVEAEIQKAITALQEVHEQARAADAASVAALVDETIAQLEQIIPNAPEPNPEPPIDETPVPSPEPTPEPTPVEEPAPGPTPEATPESTPDPAVVEPGVPGLPEEPPANPI